MVGAGGGFLIIGFTMSLLIGELAFADATLATSVKLGVIAGSLLSAGVALLFLRSRNHNR